MPKALTALKEEIQIGNESTPGTAVAAVDAILGTITAPYTSRQLHWPEDDRGSLAANFGNEFKVADETELNISMRLADIWAPWVFGTSIRGNITATQPDATNEPLAYLWTYQGGLTTGNTPDITNGIDTLTIEYGDNLDSYEVPYCFTTTLVITGAPNEPVMVDWTLTGAAVAVGNTSTAAITVSSAQYFPSNKCSFYIDANYAAIGGSAKADLLMGWTWTLETTFTPRFTASGTYPYAGVNEDRKKVVLKLEYARGTLSEVEKAKHQANTTTYLRIKCVGDTEIDSAQSNPPYVYLDGAFHYTEWPEPSDSDGQLTETVTAESVYDATGTRDFEVAVFNSLAAYPS